MKTNEELYAEIDRLRQSNHVGASEWRAQNNQLRAQVTELRTEVTRLTKENAKLNEQNIELFRFEAATAALTGLIIQRDNTYSAWAREATEVADALLAELTKPNGDGKT